MDPRPDNATSATLARLEAMLGGVQRQLDMQAKWMEGHSLRHEADTAATTLRTIALEGRLTKVEGTVSTRSWVGALGIPLSAVLSILGGSALKGQ